MQEGLRKESKYIITKNSMKKRKAVKEGQKTCKIYRKQITKW